MCGTIFEFPRTNIGKRKFCSPECHLIDYNSNLERQRSKSENVHTALQGLPKEVKLRRNRAIGDSKIGIPLSDEHKATLADCAVHSYRGGKTGDEFAMVLCPAGFVREHRIHYGDYAVNTGFGPRRKIFNLDFAHVEAKVDIELDGPGHKTTKDQDEIRDSILRDLGWRIIRIKHA